MHDLPVLFFNHGFKFPGSVCIGCHVWSYQVLI